MERSRKGGRAETRSTAARLNHGHLAGPVDLIVNANAFVESDEVGAAAEENMLTVVNDFVDARMQIGAGAPAQIAATFDKLYVKTCFSQRTGSAHAGDTTSDDRYRLVDALGQASTFSISR